jgi:hypothetical protein
MSVYMCRWENGEVSFVSAKSKKDACFLLDEFGDAELQDVHLVKDFMVSFRLSDDGEVELSEIGEDTDDLFHDKIYPVLDQVKMEVCAGRDEVTAEGKRRIREAVQEERTRLAGSMKRRLSKDPVGRRLQEQLMMSSAVANGHVEIARAKRKLRDAQ